MSKKEKATDLLVAKLMSAAGISYTAEDSNVKEIHEALATASKRGTGRQGFPEFTAMSGDFVLVVEDKADADKQVRYINDSDKATLLMDRKSITDYAENGALHYALHIMEHTNFKRFIAFGCSGTEEGRLTIRPIYVSPSGYKLLPRVKDFTHFTPEKIESYYNEVVLGRESAERVELRDILARASALHEDLRVYGQLGDSEKPLVVSAILLALQEQDFTTEDLTCDSVDTDGQKVFRAMSTHLDRVEVAPQTKKERVINQFTLIKDRPLLSQKDERLGKSPLRYFAEYLESNVLTAICNNHPEDVLGRFYGEFIRYSGGDGQTLGIVLTPRHICDLFCDLVNIKSSDRVLDPCCGTGGFLIAAMARMLEDASDKEKDNIRRNSFYGFELRDDMFSIATTNMILRGDGKSNLVCDDFLRQKTSALRNYGCTVGLMNPPYSQAKKKVSSHLTEIKFVSHLLDSLADGARCAVIVPQSTMVGKSREDKTEKRYILENHTLEGVVTLNTDTFYGVGVNPVIAVFTAHQPHPKEKLVRFVDFKDDGYEVAPHIGLMPKSDKKVQERRKLLLDCWFHGAQAPTSFIVRSTVEPDDEWLHSFYYFNDELPTDDDFRKTMADYLTFQFNMLTHGRGYLFQDRKEEANA